MARIRERLDGVYLALDRRLGGWLSLLVRTNLAFQQDDGAAGSCSIAYYAHFSLFPLMLLGAEFTTQ